MFIRVFDERVSSTVPIYDSNDFLYFDDFTGNVISSRSLITDNPIFDISSQGVKSLKEFTIGNNDVSGDHTSKPEGYMYFGGYAICRTGWCGVYRPGEE